MGELSKQFVHYIMNDSHKFWLEDYHFLKIHEGKLILWNYKNHTQFQIKPTYLQRLIEYSTGSFFDKNDIDMEILSSGILLDHQPKNIWKWDWLSHIFHYGTCHPSSPEIGDITNQGIEYAKSYADYCASISAEQPDIDLINGGTIVELPPPNLDFLEYTSLWEAMSKRRTCRDFNGSSTTLSDISDLLYATFSEQPAIDVDLPENIKIYGYKRTSPSAGGLQCTEPYLWAININGLDPGIYHYLSRQHKLEITSSTPPQHSIGTYLCNQHWANDMSFALLMTCRLDKMWWKYQHSRAYRPMLMDVGHLSQTLNLCITAKGLRPWITGYFHDQEVANLLSCPKDIEHPILVVGAGSGTGSSIDRDTRKIFQMRQSNE